MILNTGLDAACTTDGSNVTTSGNTVPMLCKFIAHAAIGTGSTAPAVTDTTLDAQVGGRVTSNGGFADSRRGGMDLGNDLIWTEETFTRVFNIAGNMNWTEWGLAAGAAGNLSVRELVRTDPADNSSTPTPVTLEAGDQLQLVITLRVEAVCKNESKSFTITGTAGNDTNGQHTGLGCIAYGTGPGGMTEALLFRDVWPGGYAPSQRDVGVFTTDQTDKSPADNYSGAVAATAKLVADAYVPGDYYVDRTATFDTATANVSHKAWIFGVPSFSTGYRFALVDPVELVKANTHRLALTVRFAISRL